MSKSNPAEGKLPHAYPAGHLHHLSADEEKALQEFKTIIKEAGIYIPSNRTTKASHDDGTLLRFLRARRFVPRDAFRQFKETEEWRKEQDIEAWYDTIDVDEFEATRVLYTHWTGRRDKRGIPLYVFKIGDLDAKKISEGETKQQDGGRAGVSSKLRRLFATYEHLTNFVMPLCSAVPSRPYPETPITQTNCIVDISGVGFRQFLSLKGHLQGASALATAHYPETLGQTFIIGAPSFFHTAWSWLQYWFDPITVSKIFFLPAGEVGSRLEKFVDIDNIPKCYGGNLDWEFGQAPVLDSDLLEIMHMQAGTNTIPKGPIRWKQSEDGTGVEAHALGTESGKPRHDTIARITSDIFWKSLGEEHIEKSES